MPTHNRRSTPWQLPSIVVTAIVLAGMATMATLGILTSCGGNSSRSAVPASPTHRPSPGTTVSLISPSPSADITSEGLPRSVPKYLDLPKIGASSSLVPLGLNTDHTLRVPPVDQPMQAGWYMNSPTPGEKGPSVLIGHVDGGGKPGIFHQLKDLQQGDQVVVTREDGRKVQFVVYRKQEVSKARFPADEVYGDVSRPELRLITCGGTFDKQAHSYRDNVIVYAALSD